MHAWTCHAHIRKASFVSEHCLHADLTIDLHRENARMHICFQPRSHAPPSVRYDGMVQFFLGKINRSKMIKKMIEFQ